MSPSPSPGSKWAGRRCFGLFFAVFLGLGGPPGAVLSAAESRIDEIRPWLTWLQGELHGVFTPVEGRSLVWNLTWLPGDESVRLGRVSLNGADCVLNLSFELERASGRLSWRVNEGRVDLGAWLPALAARPELASALDGLSVTGILTIRGEGRWCEGVITGGLRAELVNAQVRNEAQGWRLEGVGLRVGGEASELLKAQLPMDLTVRTISTARFGARNLSVKATLNSSGQIAVSAAQIQIAGGEVKTAPFTLSWVEPALDVNLRLSRVGLQDLVMLVPAALSEAQGRINGQLRLRWNSTEGVQIAEGGLELEKSEPMTLRLAASPGFLTGQMPARFTWLPAWLGPVSRWLAPANPGYKTLSQIERGKLGLRVESLQVRLTPDGDERGRSASVIIRAHPEQAGTAVGEIWMEVNVAGPLADVLRLGMKPTFSLSSP